MLLKNISETIQAQTSSMPNEVIRHSCRHRVHHYFHGYGAKEVELLKAKYKSEPCPRCNAKE